MKLARFVALQLCSHTFLYISGDIYFRCSASLFARRAELALILARIGDGSRMEARDATLDITPYRPFIYTEG